MGCRACQQMCMRAEGRTSAAQTIFWGVPSAHVVVFFFWGGGGKAAFLQAQERVASKNTPPNLVVVGGFLYQSWNPKGAF